MLDWFFTIKKRSYDFDLAPQPRINVPDETFERGFNALWTLLESNLMPPVGRLSGPWAQPASKFPAAYLWDSAFISQAWKIRDPGIGFKILKPFIEFQASDGRMPHLVFFGRNTSKLSNPPFLSWAIKHLHDYFPDNEAITYFLLPLQRFMEFRVAHRFNDTLGLYFWPDSYESGIDNTPRFRSRDEKEEYGVKYLGAIDVNTEVCIQHETFLDLLGRTGRNDEGHVIASRLGKLVGAMESKLWDSKAGIFGDRDTVTGELKTIDTIASYFPLAARAISREHKAKLLENIKNVLKYDTLMPLPSVARDSPSFVKDTWRGPVWVNTAYLVIKGAKQCGEGKLAGHLAFKLCKGVFQTWKNEGSFYEFYDPDRYDLAELSRKKGNVYKQITLGGKPVKNFAGWTALANTLLVEDVIGVYKDQDKWIVEPHIPQEWIGAGKNILLTLPFFHAEFKMNVSDEDGIDIDHTIHGKKGALKVKNHERVNLSVS